MYIPLYIKTDYSLLSSLIKIDNLINECQKNNITSVAIVDNNLFGTMEFYKKCLKNNIKPIIGLEIKIKEDTMLLYAKNEDGYKNLIKIETIKNEQELDIEILKKYSENIICIIPFQEAIDLSIYKGIFTSSFIGVSSKDEEIKAKKLSKNIVFINKTLYLEKYEYKYLPYVFMIRDGKTITEGIDFVYQNNHLLDDNEVINMVSIDAINNTLKISDMCNLKFDFDKVYMPKYDTEDPKEYLINLSKKGLARRLKDNVTKEYSDRLDYELDIIIKMHFEDYFLVVYDFIKYAKKNNILVGPGRGSAAGSLVTYSLGITEVDPLKYNLLFERFLNPERITMPDIDTDFPDNDRDKVIEYVVNKYGKDKVAGIITFGTMGAKQAVRDVGRVLNVPIEDTDFICKKLFINDTLKDLKNKNKEIHNMIESDDKLKVLYNLVNIIEGNKRHTSIHAAGIVISHKRLDEILPIVKSDDMYLTEYSMEYLEELGLIKMDFLGIKNLQVIKNVIEDINLNENININFNNIPLDDINVLTLFSIGDTNGIFQFESEGMKKFLMDLKPDSFNQISDAIALYRPGPASNIPSYIKRKEGKEKVDYLHESLKGILEETYGIIIYQEQIILIANIMSSYSLGEADILRRAMSKKKYDLLKNEEEKFIERAIKNNYSEELSKKVFETILQFAGYGFNKSHSVSYSLIAVKMAYLKYYYPKYFYSNLLASVVGSDTKTNEYIMELKKNNIKLLPPDVNASFEYKYKVTENGIILPLGTIRGIGGVISNFIVEERNKNKYKDIYDFLKRTYKKTNNKKVLEALIYSHALDCFNLNIQTLINNLEVILNYIELSIDVEENMISTPVLTIIDNEFPDDLLEKEKEIFGFYLTSHKTEKYKLNEKDIIDIKDIKTYFNKDIKIIVSIEKIKEINTKKNEEMAFINGSDNTGEMSLTLFPKNYQDIKKLNLKKQDIIKVSGRIEKRFNEYQLIVNNIIKLN